jgi:hypothetical protein
MKESTTNFFLNVLSVILGIVITFSIQGIINRAQDKKNVRSALELIRSELATNAEDISIMLDYLKQEQASAQYFMGHLQDLDQCPSDSVIYHSAVLLSDASITVSHDALELLKMSSLFQKIGDNPLSMKIIRAYDCCTSGAQNLNHHIDARNEQFSVTVNEKNVRKIISDGNIRIREFLKTDLGHYAIEALASQADPSQYTDMAAIQDAIDAIGLYLER